MAARKTTPCPLEGGYLLDLSQPRKGFAPVPVAGSDQTVTGPGVLWSPEKTIVNVRRQDGTLRRTELTQLCYIYDVVWLDSLSEGTRLHFAPAEAPELAPLAALQKGTRLPAGTLISHNAGHFQTIALMASDTHTVYSVGLRANQQPYKVTRDSEVVLMSEDSFFICSSA